MTRTCFILDELYPEDRGGIARLMHNILHHAKSLDPSLDLHVVLARKKPTEPTLEAAFAGIATLHYFRPDSAIATRFGVKNLDLIAIFPRQSEPALRELKVLDAVLNAEQQSGGFDHIEIPDHMGLGAGILQAKRAGFGFQDAEITCRIHSSLSVIINAEPFYHQRNDWLAPRLEMERFALEHADRVVAHLPTIARYNKHHFNFAPSWMDKVEIAFPPVIWPEPKAQAEAEKATDFIFSSRFQPFKRPGLFIKAAITLLDSGSDFTGGFRLISYGFSPEYIDYLRLIVPPRHHRRILVQTNISAEERLAAIASGIVVQPSKYESLCALAYEVSVQNRPLLLAKDCLAFGDDPHWQDGQNCLLFEPTPEALAKTMEAARNWQPQAPVNTTPDPPYFLRPTEPRARAKPATSVALLSGPVETTAALEKHFESPSAQVRKLNVFGYSKLSPRQPTLNFHRFSEGGFGARQWHDLAQSLNTEAVILHSPEALPTEAFIREGASILRPGLAYSSNSLDEATGRLVVYPGKLDTISVAEPRICPPCIMLHREDLFRLASDDDDDLLARLITRLARSDIALAFSPAPHVREPAHRPSPPLQRHLGFEAEPVWQNGFRWIGVATRPSQNTGLLKARPFTLTLKAEDDLLCSEDQPVEFEVNEPRVFALETDQNPDSRIFCLTVGNRGPANKIEVSLQQASGKAPLETAQRHHEAKFNIRPLHGGQSYIMRWGPIWHGDPLILVVSAEKPVKIRLANPILTSRA